MAEQHPKTRQGGVMTMQAASVAPVQGESLLPELWRRRSRLSPEEIGSLYAIVESALARYHPPELHALGEDKEELIAQFLFFKVLRLDCSHGCSEGAVHSAPSNAFALCAYFRRYLIDCLRSASFQRNVSIEGEAIRYEVDRCESDADNSLEALLREYDLNEAEVCSRARALIDRLGRTERQLLAGTLGAFSERKGGLSRLAADRGIASYHYHASKLGVVVKKGLLPEVFSQTVLGRWISDDLGIAIQPENRAVIHAALNLLAVESSSIDWPA